MQEELFRRYSVAANEKRLGAPVLGCERVEPWLRQRSDSTLYFDGGERCAMLENEIHLAVSIAPVAGLGPTRGAISGVAHFFRPSIL